MGKIFFQPQNGDLLSQEELSNCKDSLLNDFSLIDNLDFGKNLKNNIMMKLNLKIIGFSKHI